MSPLLMRNIKIIFFLFFISSQAFSQQAEMAFNQAGNLYLENKNSEAKSIIKNAQKSYPNDPKLKSLLEKIEEEEDKKNQEKQDQENKDQQNKDQQENKDKEDQKKDQEQKSEEEKKQDEEQKKQEQEQEKEQGQKDKEDQKEEDKGENGEEKKPEEMKNQPKPGEPNFEEKEISKEMAEMILQAMRNKELQYLQQLKRKPQKPVDKDKPDW